MRLDFPKPLRSRMRREVSRAGRLEIGGILMAEQLAPGDFKLVDFTVDSQRGSAAHFVRSVDDHQNALANFFQRTGSDYSCFNYLGEWHSHPNHPPIPSSEDMTSMESLVHGERDIEFAVLLVVRKRWWDLMMSATLFDRSGQPQAVEVHLGKSA
ncbi:MAG: hypothetical protein COA41_07355 [Sphingopyxis sp.]|nr:MAG: hypothetical protein COA41_07355 [Sphingopyxis sp.]